MKKLVAFAVLTAMLAGCSRGPNEKAVKTAIEAEPDSKVSMLIPYGRVGVACEDEDSHVSNFDPTTDIRFVSAAAVGLIDVTSEHHGFYKVELTGAKPFQSTRKRYHLVANGCDYEFVVIPLANKSVISVSGIQPTLDNVAEAQYAWKWTLTPVGEKIIEKLDLSQLADLDRSLGRSAFETTELHRDKVIVKKSGDSWEVVK